MLDLSFLSQVELAPVVKGANTKVVASKNPTNGADIRVTKSGKVYPSVSFVAEAALEYQPSTDENPKGGFGLDIFSSLDWGMIMGKLPTELLFIACIPKIEPKVDLFGSCGYDEKNMPKSSVLTQGGGSFGKRLVTMITAVYGIDWEIVDHVDLMVSDQTITSPNGLYAIPKIIASGDRKGEQTYQTRKSIVVSPLVLFEDNQLINTPAAPVTTTDAQEIPAPAVVVNTVVAETTAPAPIAPAPVVTEEIAAPPVNENPFFAADDKPAEEPVTFDQAVPGVDPANTKVAAGTDPGQDWANNLGQS